MNTHQWEDAQFRVNRVLLNEFMCQQWDGVSSSATALLTKGIKCPILYRFKWNFIGNDSDLSFCWSYGWFRWKWENWNFRCSWVHTFSSCVLHSIQYTVCVLLAIQETVQIVDQSHIYKNYEKKLITQNILIEVSFFPKRKMCASKRTQWISQARTHKACVMSIVHCVRSVRVLCASFHDFSFGIVLLYSVRVWIQKSNLRLPLSAWMTTNDNELLPCGERHLSIDRERHPWSLDNPIITAKMAQIAKKFIWLIRNSFAFIHTQTGEKHASVQCPLFHLQFSWRFARYYYQHLTRPKIYFSKQ